VAVHKGVHHPISPARRRRRRRRLFAPLILVAVIALAVVAVLTALGSGGSERTVATSYVRDWARGDFTAMYGLLDAASRRATSERAFVAAYHGSAVTATLVSLRALRVGQFRNGVVPVAMTVQTRLFGTLREALEVTIAGSGSDAHVRFTPALLFPGLRAREHLSRDVTMAPRASVLADDGTPLAEGPDLSSPIPSVASAIAGVLGPIPSADAARYAAEGYPPDAKVGVNGLERIFERRLAGTPGGTLRAGRRVLVTRAPRAGTTVKTTIDPRIESAIVSAMAARYSGMVALDPRTGAILGAAGIAFSAPQPPGSTMKIVTATAALQAGIVKLGDTFPISTEATIDGFPLQNANGEACGGTLLTAFAVSCNSVFAPIGVRLGPARFLATARRFGFNQPSPLAGYASSTIPPDSVAHNDLELGASAIGQGKVEATTLEMGDVAATIAMGGRRPIPTLRADQPPRFVSVTTPHVASEVERMMVAVVTEGTGVSAQISGIEVAGKTGTAELRDTTNPNNPNANSPTNTDSWFVGYAPVGAPRIVVAALFPNQGAGAETAAPAVRQVLETALSGR
jgi:penicillin-binding protein A